MKKHLEDDLTIAVANYIRMQYPRILFAHIPNGGYRNAREGSRFKRMGVRPGLPDILIFKEKFFDDRDNPDRYCGLFIELKIHPNKPNAKQFQVMYAMKREYWKGDVCYDFDSAKKLIDEYLQ